MTALISLASPDYPDFRGDWSLWWNQGFRNWRHVSHDFQTRWGTGRLWSFLFQAAKSTCKQFIIWATVWAIVWPTSSSSFGEKEKNRSSHFAPRRQLSWLDSIVIANLVGGDDCEWSKYLEGVIFLDTCVTLIGAERLPKRSTLSSGIILTKKY